MLSTISDSRVSAAVLDALPAPFFVFDEDGYYIEILGGADRQRYHESEHLIGKRIHDVIATELADRFVARIRQAILTGKVCTYVYQLSAKDIQGSENLPGPDGKQFFEAHISPIKEVEGRPRMVVWVAFNITDLQRTIGEKETLITKLRNALGEIKTLKGILPICSFCKKIRDDNGYWNLIETYIRKHSGADLSHGICPDCAKKHYPEYLAEND